MPLLLILLLFITRISAQELNQKVSLNESFPVNQFNIYKINSLNIIPFSEKLFLNHQQLDRSDYIINYERGYFNLNPSVTVKDNDTIRISYESIKIDLNKIYKRRNIVIRYDEKLLDTLRFIKNEDQPLTTESFFGKSIQKSGALIRGFTVGTNSDLQINSGLRLQLSGKLSDDIELVAALSDENTPIQPEGNTETLEEIDKVFIELKHKNAVGTFGDYELNIQQSEFARLTRKLQGSKGEFNIDNNKGIIAVAGSRGKYNSQFFMGMDGNQGPYRLFGLNGEKQVIIIAGSEKVFLDGEQMKRGENNDYVIDYSNSEITFTPKRMITSASRITVDFEYSDQNFKRNFYGVDYSTKLFDEHFNFGFSYFREGDDQNNPIDFSFSETDKLLIENSGDDRTKAVRSGVSSALPDSLGFIHGNYIKVDTLISNNQFTFYRYNPENINAIFNVTFSFVGFGKGDYIKESLGNYRFVGINNGSYAPLIYLPMPELKQISNFFFKSVITEGINLKAELSLSDWDKNLFSNYDDSDNFGYARSLMLEIEPREVKIVNINFGKIGVSLKDRYIQKKYSSLDRFDNVEFNRYYNLSNATNNDQTLREIKLNLIPSDFISFTNQYGYLKQGENFSSDRFYSNMKIEKENSYHLDYIIDYVKTLNGNIKSEWNKQNGNISYRFDNLKPGFDYLYEKKNDSVLDSLHNTSLKYFQTSPFLEYNLNNILDIKASYSFREEYFPLNNELILQSKSYTKQLSLNLKGLKEISTILSLSLRDKKITDEFKIKGIGDNSTVLVLSQTRFNFWNNFITGDVYYQASTEQNARLEKVFLKVPKGSGNYIYLGDLNNNGLNEENEFQLSLYDGEFIIVTTPTDQLFPVIDLKVNSRFKLSFNKIINGNNLIQNTLKAINTETSFRVEEISNITDTKQIYLLNFEKFMNDSTTIRGIQFFQQDIFIFQNSSDFSIRLRYLERKNLNQYAGGLEKGYFRENGIRIRFKMIAEVSNQTDISNQVDNMISPPTTSRTRQVNKNEIVTDFTYRPIRNVETGLKINISRSEDSYPDKPIIIDYNSVTLRTNYSIANYGRIRFEVERTELTANENNVSIPFEITRGNVIGKNYFWRVFFDYKITGYLQTSINYDGRLQGKSRAIHTMRAEARAYF